MVQQIKDAQEFQTVLAQPAKLIVVDFFATWCGPCKMISPMLEKFSEQYSAAQFVKVDVDEVPELAQQHEVSAMPTLVLFKDGKEVARVVGANPAAFKQAIAANL